MFRARVPAIDGHISDGPLAEFAALRVEIQERVRTQQQMLSLQLTMSGAVFGFTLSQRGMIALPLIVPFISYLLCGRLVAQHFGTLRVAEYIKDHLSCRVPGGLEWEQWLRRRPRSPHFLGWGLPLILAFVGSSVLALGWTFSYVFLQSRILNLPYASLILLWFLGLTVTILSTVLLLQMAGKLSLHSWDDAGLS